MPDPILKNRKLGPTDIEVSPVGLGCWQFSGGKGMAGRFWPALSAEDTNEIVRVSLEGGINWFDTAEMYGHGQSEANLAASLRVNGKADGDVVVATKWFPFFRRAKSILRTIDERLRYLGGYSIDLHQIHAGRGSLSSYEKQMNAMADLDFSLDANSCEDLEVAVDGAGISGDTVVVGAPSNLNLDLSVTGFVKAVGLVSVRLCNPTGAAIDPVPGSYRVDVWQHQEN